MANFKAALEALATGKLNHESLSKQLDNVLNASPNFANKMLSELDEIHSQKKLDDNQYSILKDQIIKFRRANTLKKEAKSLAKKQQKSTKENTPSAKTSNLNDNSLDSTVIGGEEKTVIGGEENEATVVAEGSGTKTAAKSSTTKTQATIAPGNATKTSGEDEGNYGPGSIIKQRFKLEKVLGIGGMGKVYKALDLLKAEAKDKKPYVAIKLLNEDFKDHPEAFISLQRESSRQQKLAHPNIATIYDFDRVGGPGTPVYITMELMEGMELKDFIRKKVRPKKGLPFEEAYEIIKQLGAGLTYAHELRLVHSDFKPGNAFLCNDGTVKTLDFGIARAVKNPVAGEAEKTLFDPGKLGALTPAYASLEMLEGEEPDTRDDTYALGCTAYELLTAKHPFNKLAANKAKENNLIPPEIKHLNKKQNRALKRGVAFHRADRSPTVEHFVEELEGKATWHKNPFVIAAAVLIILTLMLISPTIDYLHQRTIDSLITEINKGDQQTIIGKLDEILLLDKTDQATIADEAKNAIQNYFSDKVAFLTDADNDSFDFPAANMVIQEIGKFYPESQFLERQTTLVTTSKKKIISDLNAEYVSALKDPQLIDNTKNILEKIARIEPGHPLLEDPRPSNAYRLLAIEKFEANQFASALELVKSGLTTAKDDVRLNDLEKKIQRAQRVAQLESELNIIKKQLTSLISFKDQQAIISELANLSPDSDLVQSLSIKFMPLMQKELDVVLKTGARNDAKNLISNFSALMVAFQLNDQLTEVRLAHLTGDARKKAIFDMTDSNINSIESALASANIDNQDWEIKLLRNIQELSSLSKKDTNTNKKLINYREKISSLYLEKAGETLQEERFDAADGYLDIVERFSPGLELILETRNAISSARDESERKAKVEANKSDFKIFTEANNIVEAEKLFDQLKADIPQTDTYITSEAPRLLADSYARLAQTNAENKDYIAAFSLVTKGLELDLTNEMLRSLKDEYQAEANILELTELFKNSLSFPTNVRLKIDQIENYASPTNSSDFRKNAANVLAERINSLKAKDENAAAGLAQTAARLFPASSILASLKNELKLKPWSGLSEANAAIASGKLTEASQIEKNASEKFGTHPQFISFLRLLDDKKKEAQNIFKIYQQDMESAGEEFEKLKVAKSLLSRAKSFWTDSPEILDAEDKLNQLIAKVKPKPKPKIRAREGSIDSISGNTNDGGSRANWKPIESDSECTKRLAGYGKRAKAICFDMIHKSARGPLMVVVPNGETYDKPFAIAKYEISVSDWSKYCILSNTCSPIKDKDKRNDPIRNITMQQAKDYASWLSERTGKIYRIPTKSEWEYAANAGGKQPKKDFNCRVSVNQKLIKGTGIVSVKSGKSNGWGLKNYIGNVQEWVIGEGGLLVRGGAYTDAHSKCAISLERTHKGEGDEATGFRLMREDVG